MSVCLSTYLKFLFRLLVGAWIFYRLFLCVHMWMCVYINRYKTVGGGAYWKTTKKSCVPSDRPVYPTAGNFQSEGISLEPCRAVYITWFFFFYLANMS